MSEKVSLQVVGLLKDETFHIAKNCAEVSREVLTDKDVF